jgi:rhodanese-related sulfurtransferase
MDRITREDLRTLLKGRAMRLVEALPREAFDVEHIPGALNLPGPLTPELAAHLAPEKAGTVVVYCSGPFCNRSKVAAAAFTRLGYTDVRVYAGGKADRVQAGLPLEGARAEAVA